MIDLGALKATIKVDDTEAKSKIKDLGTESEKTESKLSGLIEKAGTVAKAALVGLGGAIGSVSGAMVKFTADSLETTANIEKFSATCNVSKEEFQRLDGVFKQVGWSMEGAAGDFAALSEKMMEAAQEGEGESYEIFKKLGVAVTDTSGKLRNTGDVFNDMILSLQNVSDETERQALASIMLGTTSEELAPLLKMTNEEFKAMKDNVNVLSDEQLSKANEFRATWNNLKQTFETVVTEIGISLMPMFGELASWVTEHMPQIRTIIETAFDAVTDIVGQVVDTINLLFPIFEELANIVTEHMSEVQEIAVDVFKAIIDVVKTVIDNFDKLIPIIAGAVAGFVAFKVVSTVVTLFTTLKTTITAVSTAQGILNALMAANPIGMVAIAIGALVAAGVALYMNWDKVTEVCKKLWTNLTKWFDDICKSFNDMFKDIKNFASDFFQVGVDLFTGLWNGIKSVWNKLTGWITESCNAVISTVKGIFDIHSPSRVMKEIGKNITEGMTEGIKDGKTNVKNSMSEVGSEALAVIRQYYTDSKNLMTEKQTEEYNNRKQLMQGYIDDQKYYNKLSLEEEYNLYLGMKDLAKGNKEEIAYWEKEMYRVKKEMREEDIQNLKDANSKYRELYLQQVKEANAILTATSNEEIAKLEAELDKMDEEDKKAAYNERYSSFEEQIKALEKKLAEAAFEERKAIQEDLNDKQKEFDKWLAEEDRKAKREALKQQIQDEKDALDAKIKNNEAYAEKHLAVVDAQLDESIKAIESGIDKETLIQQAKNITLKQIDDENVENQKTTLVDRENAITQSNEKVKSDTENFATEMYKENYAVGASFANGIADGILNQTYRVTKAISMLVDGMKSQLDRLNFDGLKTINGSHRNGLDYVPYDGYVAELHAGERVLTAEQARQMQSFDTSKIEKLLELLNTRVASLPKEYRTVERMGYAFS